MMATQPGMWQLKGATLRLCSACSRRVPPWNPPMLLDVQLCTLLLGQVRQCGHRKTRCEGCLPGAMLCATSFHKALRTGHAQVPAAMLGQIT